MKNQSVYILFFGPIYLDPLIPRPIVWEPFVLRIFGLDSNVLESFHNFNTQ